MFVVETYTTMSKACYDCPSNVTDCYRPHCIPADGYQKTIYVANRQLPGPTIEVTLKYINIILIGIPVETTNVFFLLSYTSGMPKRCDNCRCEKCNGI